MKCDDCSAKIAKGEDIFIEPCSYDIKKCMVICPGCYKHKYSKLEKPIKNVKLTKNVKENIEVKGSIFKHGELAFFPKNLKETEVPEVLMDNYTYIIEKKAAICVANSIVQFNEIITNYLMGKHIYLVIIFFVNVNKEEWKEIKNTCPFQTQWIG